MGNKETPGFVRALLAMMLIASAGCPREQLHVSLAGTDPRTIGAWYETGDILDLVARVILIEHGGEPDPPSSAEAPTSYKWSSSKPAVAAVTGLGRLQMLDTGQATITVSGPGASKSFAVNVLPRISMLRLTPDSTAIGVGESATLVIEPLDATGRRLEAYSSLALPAPYGRGVRLSGLKIVGPAGVVATAAPAGDEQWTVAGLANGTVRLAAFVATFSGARLGDSSKVVVR